MKFIYDLLVHLQQFIELIYKNVQNCKQMCYCLGEQLSPYFIDQNTIDLYRIWLRIDTLYCIQETYTEAEFTEQKQISWD